jgi:diguanylate cyclase (GGDEF)-like protein/PAS domain S-box-containing protein
MIGVLAPVPNGFYFGGLLGGINRAVASAGGRVVAVQTIDPAHTGTFEEGLKAPLFDVPVAWSRFDGVISLVEAVRPPYLHRLSGQGMPIVLVSKQLEGLECPSVMPDNIGGIEAAVEHLVHHGHQRIAFVGDMSQSDIRERHSSYRCALRRHGIEPDDSLFIPATDNLLTGGYAAGKILLGAELRLDALVAATDLNAIGVMRTLQAAGWSLPDDLAVIGFDNIDEAAQVTPALSTVVVPLDRLGELAANLLLRQIEGKVVAPGVHLGSSALVVRRSCGCGQRLVAENLGASVQLSAGLRVALVPEAMPLTSVLQRLDAVVSKVVDLFDGTQKQDLDGSAAIESLVAALQDLGPRLETIRHVMGIIRQYTNELAAAGVPRQKLDSRLIDLAMALREFEARTNATFRVSVKRWLEAHYEVGVALLRADQEDPSTLSWFARTNLAAGCLGMWQIGDDRLPAGELTITGAYGADPALAALVGDRMPAESFPPAAVVDQIDATADEVLHVVLVRSGETLWGLLAAPAKVQELTVEGREPLNDWAAFLAVAFEQQRDRDDLRAVHFRERELAEHLRVSEERYALAARASNDGLWDWDLSNDTVFYSERWSIVLGQRPTKLESSPSEWLSRVHPDDLSALREALNACVLGEAGVLLNEHRVMTADTSYRWMSCRAIGVPGTDGKVARLVGALTDIDDRRQLEERLRHAALYDELTGLPNRTQFLDHLQQAFTQNSQHPSHKYAVLFCDLDGFKTINDTLGHHIGDLLLTAVATRLADVVRGSDLVARLGGDEFALLLNDIDDNTLHEVVSRIHRIVGEPFQLEGHNITVGNSVGVATSDIQYNSPAEILREADAAMYRAKINARPDNRLRDAPTSTRTKNPGSNPEITV